MATRRNALGEALERLSGNMLEVAMHNQRMGLQERQLALSERAQESSERMDAFQRVLNFAPFVKPDTTIAENPFIHDSIREAWGPEAGDPADPNGIGGIVFNEQSFEQIIRPMLIDSITNMSESDRTALMEKARNQAILGIAESDEGLALRDDIIALRQSALSEFVSDPISMETIARTTMGLEPITRVTLPGGRVVEYDTVASANLAVRIWEAQQGWALQRELSGGAKADLAGELMKQAETMGILLSRPRAMQIINTVHNPDEEAAAAGVAQLRMSSPEVATALDMYLQGAAIAEDAVPAFVRETDPELANFLDLGAFLGEKLGAEAAGEILPEISARLRGQGATLPRPSRSFQLWRQSGIQPRPDQAGSMTSGNAEDINADRINQQQDAMTASLQRRQEMDADINSYLAGDLTAAQIRSKYPKDYLVIFQSANYRRSRNR